VPDAWLIDSNILIRWVKPDDRDYALVASAMEKLIEKGATLCYTSQNLGEFWNACTRPVDRNGYGLNVAEANSRANVIERALLLLADSVAVHREWRRLLVEYQVSGILAMVIGSGGQRRDRTADAGLFRAALYH
jgi:hypothetical protein